MSVRPLVLWVTRQPDTTLRFTKRGTDQATGILTTGSNTIPFTYQRAMRILQLPDREIKLNDYGWELDDEGQIVFRSSRVD